MDVRQSVREVFSSNVSLNLVSSHVGRDETVLRTPKTRDSSADSGIHPASNTSPTLSISDTDTEILEAFSRWVIVKHFYSSKFMGFVTHQISM